jgi:hypothetical protein
MVDTNAAANAARTRKPVVPPAIIPETMTLLDYLSQCQPALDQKIIDIACSQTQIPQELKKDAAQEIRLMWAAQKPDVAAFKPGQIASYGHRMACHAALRLRRDLGSAVRLPGSAFRKRKDGSSYVTPGVLAHALEWDKLEGWFNADGGEGGEAPSSMDGMSSDMGLNPLIGGESEMAQEEDSHMVAVAERMEQLEAARDELTPRQFEIMRTLIEGSSLEDVMKDQDIKKGVLMREIAIISSIVGTFE